jgi:hypothetical protein
MAGAEIKLGHRAETLRDASDGARCRSGAAFTSVAESSTTPACLSETVCRSSARGF